MEGLEILWSIVLGVATGAIAGWITNKSGFGSIINFVAGVAGGLLGGWIYSRSGIDGKGILGILLMSVAGAIVMLWMISLYQDKGKQKKYKLNAQNESEKYNQK